MVAKLLMHRTSKEKKRVAVDPMINGNPLVSPNPRT
jgi:hypothetical protein